MAGEYSLQYGQVPEYPYSGCWADELQWIVAVMQRDDPDLAFVASLLSYALRHDGLTERQARHARRITEKFWALWLANGLPCQRQASGRDLASLQAVGSA